MIFIRTFTVCINEAYRNGGWVKLFSGLYMSSSLSIYTNTWTKLPALEDLKDVISREV